MKKWLLLGFSLLLLLAFVLPSHAYQCLRTTGAGYASITDANQAGLNMGLSDFMVEVRFRTSSDGTNQYIIDKELATVGYYIRIDDALGDTIRAVVGSGSGALRQFAYSDSAVNDGRWHYLVLVVDRSGNMTVFIDGAAGTGASLASVGNVDSAVEFVVGGAAIDAPSFIGLTDEVRVWNLGYGGLPSDYADYITWRTIGRNVFKDISLYDEGSWNLYADAVQTDLHDGAGTVAGMVVGEKYGYETATPNTLDHQGGTLDDDGVFTATHTTGTIAGGDADDHVRRVGLTARYKFEGDYTDETQNSNTLVEGGSGNVCGLGYTLKKQKIISPLSVW